jgi:signal transduction histidine kinase
MRAETEVALAFPRDAAYYREAFDKVQQSSMQMSRLIDQLLALARTDAGVDVLHLEPMDLFELVEEVASPWRDIYAAADIRFDTRWTADSRWVQGDHAALRRLLNTLLENAWRYTPAGGAVVLSITSSGTLLEAAVEDTGIGIAEHDQPRVFQRFFRAAQPLNGNHAGSGLGLALAQWIAECHGTSLTVQSRPGAGSRFALHLKTAPQPDAVGLSHDELPAASRASVSA